MRQYNEGSHENLVNVDLMLNDEDSTQYAEWMIQHVMYKIDYVNDGILLLSRSWFLPVVFSNKMYSHI